MNYKYDCIDELKNYRYRVQSLESLPDEIKFCSEQMDGIHSAATDAIPVKGGGSTREERLVNAIVRKGNLEETLKTVKWKISRVEKGLSLLTDEQRRILELFYMRREWGYKERLCKELNISMSELYRRKDEALRQYALCRYGMTEN